MGYLGNYKVGSVTCRPDFIREFSSRGFWTHWPLFLGRSSFKGRLFSRSELFHTLSGGEKHFLTEITIKLKSGLCASFLAG